MTTKICSKCGQEYDIVTSLGVSRVLEDMQSVSLADQASVYSITKTTKKKN